MGKAKFNVSARLLAEMFQLNEFEFIDATYNNGVITFVVESASIKDEETMPDIRPIYKKVNAYCLQEISVGRYKSCNECDVISDKEIVNQITEEMLSVPTEEQRKKSKEASELLHKVRNG